MYGRTGVSSGRASVPVKGYDVQFFTTMTDYTSRFDTTSARPSVPTAVTRPVLHDNGSPSDRSERSDTSDSSDLPSNL